VCHTGNRGNIDDFDERIGWCFEEDEGRVFVEEGFHCVDIRGIDMVNCDSVMRR